MAGGLHAPAEQRLRLYETLLQTTPDLVYMWDLQHRFTYANAALLALKDGCWAISRDRLRTARAVAELAGVLQQTRALLGPQAPMASFPFFPWREHVRDVELTRTDVAEGEGTELI